MNILRQKNPQLNSEWDSYIRRSFKHTYDSYLSQLAYAIKLFSGQYFRIRRPALSIFQEKGEKISL